MSDQILNIKFVQEVEKYPCLYNYKLADYSRRDVTERAWSAVGNEFNWTVNQCKEKWKNLRAVFVRHLKPAPSGPSVKNKKYYLNDVMQFTIPYIKALHTNVSGNLNMEASIREPEIIEEEAESSLLESDSVMNTTPSMSCTLPASSPMSIVASSPMSCPTPSQSKSHNKRKLTAVDEGITQYFDARKAHLKKKTDDVEDPKRMFLLCLLPDIKLMSNNQTRQFKIGVLSLINEILSEGSEVAEQELLYSEQQPTA